MKLFAALPASALLLLCACGGGGGDTKADQLDAAAEQSDPAAAAVLQNAADAAREGNGAAPQQALEDAGNAQAATLPTPTPPSKQAQPHKPGDPVPPPQAEANVQ